jgi:hypothetical protein
VVMQRIRNNNIKKKGLEGGHYARTEEELYKKAIGVLEKCKVEARREGDVFAAAQKPGFYIGA